MGNWIYYTQGRTGNSFRKQIGYVLRNWLGDWQFHNPSIDYRSISVAGRIVSAQVGVNIHNIYIRIVSRHTFDINFSGNRGLMVTSLSSLQAVTVVTTEVITVCRWWYGPLPSPWRRVQCGWDVARRHKGARNFDFCFICVCVFVRYGRLVEPNMAISDLSKAISRKRWKIGGKLVLITNRKSYISFRLVQKSVTLEWPWAA